MKGRNRKDYDSDESKNRKRSRNWHESFNTSCKRRSEIGLRDQSEKFHEPGAGSEMNGFKWAADTSK